MLAGMSLGTDLKRFSRGAMPRIALVTVVLMPLLYGAMYLWAFWNPFDAVNKVPVALVNEDTGTVVDGKKLDAGAQVADALVDSGQLQLHQVSAAEAADGVSSGRYYFSVTLPQDFSAIAMRLASPACISRRCIRATRLKSSTCSFSSAASAPCRTARDTGRSKILDCRRCPS